LLQGKATKASITNSFNTVGTPVNLASAPRTSNDARPSFVSLVQNTGIFGSAFDDKDLDTYNSPFADQVMGVEADFNNMEPSTIVSPIPILLLIKYVGEILKKFGFSSIRTASTPMETNKALTKDEDGKDVDVHLYRLMIGSLMYLTSSRPDIMFSVYACSRFQVQPKVSYLNAVKRIFRYLKGRPNLGLWYHKDSPFVLEAFSDSDYVGASLDRKSTTGGCQFLSSRLISWQCKKKTVVANLTTEAEYIAASHCCGQVLWIQNQMLDYEYNFMQIKIHVDNESAICVVKNPVYYSKTKHIEIRHHFIRDSYEKRLIEMVKIHTDNNAAYLLTKAFDMMKYTQVLFGLKLEWITTEPLPTETPPPVFLEPQTEAHIEQLLPSSTTYQRKRKTQKRRRTKKDTKLPQTSVPQDLKADKAIHKKGVTGMDTGGSPRSQDTMRDAPAQTREREGCSRCGDPKTKEKSQEISVSQPRRRKFRHVESLDDDLDEGDASKQGRSLTRQSQCYEIAKMEMA
ncbi:hypothetical protein Tco_1014337, partial [Tanacetum coccineum]